MTHADQPAAVADMIASWPAGYVVRQSVEEMRRLEQSNAELLAALEAVRAYLQTGKWDQPDGVDNVLRAAIAKARGQ